MAISKESLKSRWMTKLTGKGFNLGAVGREPNPWLDWFLDCLADGVVEEIQENAKAVGTDSNNDSHTLSIE